MRSSIRKMCLRSLWAGLVVMCCLLEITTTYGSSISIDLGESTLVINAEEAPLGDILAALAEKTGLTLRLGEPLTESVSCTIKANSIEEAIRRLLASHSYSLTYQKKQDGISFPDELKVLANRPHGQTVAGLQNVNVQEPITTTSLSDESEAHPGDDPPRDEHQKKIKRERFQQEFENLDALMEKVAAVPISGEPLSGGVRIMRLSGENALQQIGLNAGDVILNVNGYPVRSAQQLLQSLQSPPGGQRMLRIERIGADGSPDPIYIELQ